MRSIKILILCAFAMALAGKGRAQIVQPLSYKDYSAPYQFNIGGGVLKTTASSAYLEIGQPSGSTKGLLLPRGSKDAIASPAMGLVIYDIPSSKVWWYTGSQWATAGTDTTTGGTTTTTITFQPPITLVGSTVKWTGTTTNVPEGVNLYWRQGRFDTAFAGKTTTNLTEGLNLYYTNARVQAFGDTRYVLTQRFLDSIGAIKLKYLLASDTSWMHQQLVALQSGTGTLSNIKYVNGLYYKLSTNEVGAYYWQPIWNAKDLQGIHLKAIQPLHGMGIHYNANTNQWEPSYDSSFAGGGTGGIDLESLFWKADTADFLVTEDPTGFVGVGNNVHLKPNPIINTYYTAPYLYFVYQNGRVDSTPISGFSGLESDPLWTADKSNYYTKTNLQTSGQASIHWDNLTNVPAFVSTESDPIYTAGIVNYYTKTNLQTSGQAAVHWNNITNAPSFLTANQTIALSGDVSGTGTTSIATTLATVNSNVGTFTNATVTVDAKGRVTAASNGTSRTKTLFTDTYSATPTFDGTYINHTMTLTGNVTSISVSNLNDGECMYILFVQDATGSRTVPSGTSGWISSAGKIESGTITLTTAGSSKDLVGIKRMGSTYYISYKKDFK